MKKALLTFVGKQDPNSDATNSEGSIITLAKHIRPDLVFMFPSKNQYGVKSETETNAQETRDWLITFLSMASEDIFIHALPLEDPRDIPIILELGSIQVKGILAALGKDKEEFQLVINCSSGTPSMQSCWYIWANSGLFAPYTFTLYQVGDPRLVDEEKRVAPVTYEFLEEANTIERISRYLESALFFAAAEEARKLAQISSYSHRRMKADFVGWVCRAYHSWDLLNYRQAQDILRKAVARYDRSLDLAECILILKEQLSVLEHLTSSSTEDIYNLTDIYFNAQRRFGRHAYADVLARIWRLIEGCLYYRLRNKYGIEPRYIGQSANLENRKLVLDIVDVYKELSYYKSLRVLTEVFKDTQYIAFLNRDETLPWGKGLRNLKIERAVEDIRNVRNESIIAHGIQPVSQEIAGLSLALGEQYLDFTFKNAAFLQTYPLQGTEISKLLHETLH